MTKTEILENVESYLAWKTEWEAKGMTPEDAIEMVRHNGGETIASAAKTVIEEMEAYLLTQS